MNQDDFNKLFEDSTIDGYGCVLFDTQDLNGPSGKPTKGWASKNGAPAKLIYSLNDLDSDIKWLSNLDKGELWKYANKKIKDSSYLRTDLNTIMKELGLTLPETSTAIACQTISEIFGRIMMLSAEHYNITDFDCSSLVDELRLKITQDDQTINDAVDEALTRCFTDLIQCNNVKDSSDLVVTLKRPRVIHAQQVLNTTIPSNEWKVVMPHEFPDGVSKFEWLLSQKKPAIVRIATKGFNSTCPDYIPALLQTGESLVYAGRKKTRDWLTLQEVQYFSKYLTIEIKAALIATEWVDFKPFKEIYTKGPLSYLSYSLGIMAECHWISLSSRFRDPITKQKIKVSPRACFFRASDRFYCFLSAVQLASNNIKVLSYGAGGVTVAINKKDIKKLIELCAVCSLIFPAHILQE